MFSQPATRQSEFQAVILAGHGSALFPLTGKDNLCKALLPVGNEPMISAVLGWVEQAGILDVLILTPSTYHAPLSHHLQSYRQSQTTDPSLAMKIDLVAVENAGGGLLGGGGTESEGEDEEEEEEVVRRQTADLLRRHRDLITTDFVLLPCDFLPPPSLSLQSLLNAHRTRPNSTFTSLFYERSDLGKDGPERILVGYEKKEGKGRKEGKVEDGTLLYVKELESTEDDVELRLSMLRKFPKVTLTKNLLDSHVYVFKHSVLDLLSAYPQIESVREELVPWLVKGGFQTRLARRWASTLNPTKDPQSLALQHSTSHLPPSVSFPSTIPPSELTFPSNLASSPQPPSTSKLAQSMDDLRLSGRRERDVDSDDDEDDEGRDRWKVSCGLLIHRLDDGFVARANHIPTYFELNRQFLKAHAIAAQSVPSPPPTPGLVNPKAQISSDSLIGASTKVGERTNVKKSVVGRHCVIGKNVRISGCVVMDFVQIEDGAKIENSILAQRCVIGERASLTDCEVGGQFVVLAESKVKGEKLADMS